MYMRLTLKNPTKKLFKLQSELVRVTVHKVSYKNQVHLHMPEMIINEKFWLFIMAKRKLGKKFLKDVYSLYTEN